MPAGGKPINVKRSAGPFTADWDGDGDLDLLVGDITYQKPNLPEFTDEQKAEHERIKKELEKILKNNRELGEKLYNPSETQTKEQIEQLKKQREEVRNHMMELRSKLPAEYERHGWVWLFLRKKN